MAINDVYQLQWASELEGAAAVNTLYYRQVQEITGPDSPEQQLAIDWFGNIPQPWGLLAGRLPDSLAVNLARTQRVFPVPGLVNFRSVGVQGGVVTPPKLYMPTQVSAQFSWQGSQTIQDLRTNRMNLIGFASESVAFNGWNDGMTNWASSWAPALLAMGSSGSASGDTWILQFRQNTGGMMEDVTYEDASLPFLRSFPVRIGSRTTRTLSA